MSVLERGSRVLRQVLSRDGGADAPVSRGTSRTIGAQASWMLGLERQPFCDHASPRELFQDDAIAMQLNALAQQLAEATMLPILRGEPGSGKTSLLIQLMAQTGQDYHYFVARGEERLAAERVVVDMLRVLVRPVPARASECFRELAHRLRVLVGDGRPAVLVVDDADAIADQELERLLAVYDKLRTAVDGRFRLLLAADATIEPRLARLHSQQLDSGQVFTSNIRPLNRNRIPGYLSHRLAMAGYDGPLPLDDETLDALARDAMPLPREVERGAAEAINARWPD